MTLATSVCSARLKITDASSLRLLSADLLMKILSYLSVQHTVDFLRRLPQLRPLLNNPALWMSRILDASYCDKLSPAERSALTRHVRHLDLAALDGLPGTELAKRCIGYHCLVSITLASCRSMEDDDVRRIVERHGDSLQSLDICGCVYLTNMTLQNLSRHCRRLRTLRFSQSLVTACGFGAFADSVAARPLQSLSLSRCPLLDTSSLVAQLKSLPALVALDLSKNDTTTGETLKQIAALHPNLRFLDVSDSDRLTVSDIDAAMRSNPSLVIKHNCKLRDESLEAIQEYLLELMHAQPIDPASPDGN